MQKNELVDVLMDFGEAMLLSGAEVNRVEDTLSRIGMASGAKQMNVFTITSSIIITVIFQDGSEATQSRRILRNADINYDRLESLNALSRRYCSEKMSVAELGQALKQYQGPKHSTKWDYIGAILATGSFCVFFGGNFLDAFISMVISVCIVYMQMHFSPYCTNQVMFNYLCTLFSGILIGITVMFVPILHMDKIMIGDIMLLIPGIAITTSVKDILVGDTISGALRFMESLIWAGALACGFISAMYLCGGVCK